MLHLLLFFANLHNHDRRILALNLLTQEPAVFVLSRQAASKQGWASIGANNPPLEPFKRETKTNWPNPAKEEYFMIESESKNCNFLHAACHSARSDRENLLAAETHGTMSLFRNAATSFERRRQVQLQFWLSS